MEFIQKKEISPKENIGEPYLIEFEDTKLYGVTKPEAYLTSIIWRLHEIATRKQKTYTSYGR